MMRFVLYAIGLCVFASSVTAQPSSDDIFAIRRMKMCRALETSAREPERSIRVIVPEKSSLVSAINLNVRISHKLAAMTDIAREMKLAIEEDPRGKNMTNTEKLRLSLVMGCSHPSVGEFVSYTFKVDVGSAAMELALPVAAGTPFPLDINICGRDRAGKVLCLYGTAFEEWEDTILLAPRSRGVR